MSNGIELTPRYMARNPTTLRVSSLRIVRDLVGAEHPVLFFQNGIGDALLSLPAVRALADLFAGRLSLICPQFAHQLLYFGLRFRQVIEIPTIRTSIEGVVSDSNVLKGRPDPRVFDARSVAMQADWCDSFLSIVPWHSTCLEDLVLRLMPHTTAGFFPFFDLVAPFERQVHSADVAFRLPAALSPSLCLADYAGPPVLPREAGSRARQIREMLPRGTRLLVVHPDTDSDRCWVAQRITCVLDEFLERRPDFYVFVVGRCYADLAVGRYANRVISCLGLPLDVTVALVGEADLFLGIDSCMLHAADLFRVPGVGLFGPGAVAEWGFRFGPHRHVIGISGMAHIRATDVQEALEDLAAEQGL